MEDIVPRGGELFEPYQRIQALGANHNNRDNGVFLTNSRRAARLRRPRTISNQYTNFCVGAILLRECQNFLEELQIIASRNFLPVCAGTIPEQVRFVECAQRVKRYGGPHALETLTAVECASEIKVAHSQVSQDEGALPRENCLGFSGPRHFRAIVHDLQRFRGVHFVNQRSTALRFEVLVVERRRNANVTESPGQGRRSSRQCTAQVLVVPVNWEACANISPAKITERKFEPALLETFGKPSLAPPAYSGLCT